VKGALYYKMAMQTGQFAQKLQPKRAQFPALLVRIVVDGGMIFQAALPAPKSGLD